MENHTGNINWQPPDPPEGKPNKNLKDLPNAVGAFVMGIVALCVTPICCCYGNFVGLGLSIIGLVLANGCLREYQTDIWGYKESHYKYAKSARLLNLIALIASSILTLIFLIMLAIGSNPVNYKEFYNN